MIPKEFFIAFTKFQMEILGAIPDAELSFRLIDSFEPGLPRDILSRGPYHLPNLKLRVQVKRFSNEFNYVVSEYLVPFLEMNIYSDSAFWDSLKRAILDNLLQSISKEFVGDK